MSATRTLIFWALIAWAVMPAPARAANADKDERHLLYVVCPGIRNYLEFGGAGILVFDMDKDHAFVKRIETNHSKAEKPDNIKGVCAHAGTKRLFFTTPKKLYAFDLATEKDLWEKELPEGCDRMSITPDGKLLYVPSFEKDTWNVINPATGDVITSIETKSGAHNTVVGLDGKRMYMGGLKSPLLFVADTSSHKVVQKVGPFGGSVRPFTVNAAQTRAYVCVNDLLGFEIGDIESGKLLHRVEVKGFEKGKVKRHGCPSHGIGLTPDEKEVWVVDAANERVHIFDNTMSPPKQGTDIKLREQPGWVTFSLDGRWAYPSTGEVIDTKTKKIVTALKDEKDRGVHSEKMVEIVFKGGVPVRTGDQFGVGRAGKAWTLLTPEDKPFAAWDTAVDQWAQAESAAIDEKNPRKLSFKEGKGILVNGPTGRARDMITRDKYGDAEVHVEFMIPKGSNSGVKLMGLYEIQIVDSHGKKDRELTGNDLGGIYPRAEDQPKYHHIDKGTPPSVNASKPAGEWQTLDILFTAPRFDAEGKKTSHAKFVKVVLNDKVIHENAEVQYPTGSAWRLKKEAATGPLLLQADHGPVAFRNVQIRPAEAK